VGRFCALRGLVLALFCIVVIVGTTALVVRAHPVGDAESADDRGDRPYMVSIPYDLSRGEIYFGHKKPLKACFALRDSAVLFKTVLITL